VGRGRVDGSPLVIVPLLKGAAGVRGLLLAHVEFHPALSPEDKAEVLGDRYRDIRNLINEYNLPWDDRYLEPLSLESLFGESVETIVERIRLTLSG